MTALADNQSVSGVYDSFYTRYCNVNVWIVVDITSVTFLSCNVILLSFVAKYVGAPDLWVIEDLLDKELARCKSHEDCIALLQTPLLRRCPFLLNAV
jgi:hypothetical protein